MSRSSLPLFLLRTLPSLYGRRRLSPKSYQGLHKPKTRSLLDLIWGAEVSLVSRGTTVPFGTSIIAVCDRTK